MSSKVIQGHPRSSKVIQGHPRSSKVIQGHSKIPLFFFDSSSSALQRQTQSIDWFIGPFGFFAPL